MTLVKSFNFPGLVDTMQEELRGQVSSLEMAHRLAQLPWVGSGEAQPQRLHPMIFLLLMCFLMFVIVTLLTYVAWCEGTLGDPQCL